MNGNKMFIDINDEIKEIVIDLKRKYRLKLPDGIIISTAMYLDLPLISADQEFKKAEELNLIFYER
jgi:predicted nucleic acid-binding protein